jgi:hypothetical protein
MNGVYQHCSEKVLLHRYLAEFDSRYSKHSKLGIEDKERARAIGGFAGKRLPYKISDAAQ